MMTTQSLKNGYSIIFLSALLLSGVTKVLTRSVLVLAALCLSSMAVSAKSHPTLVINADDVVAMKAAIHQQGKFKDAYLANKTWVDQQLQQVITVPVPKDGGGGYTHERHKKNYKVMYDAGVIYQLTGKEKYADYVRDMLLAYADLYPTLPPHPKRKIGKQNPGKLFWQSLNEAVWLVYTSQAYDLILASLNTAEKNKIETGLFRPIVRFLSVESPATFNKVHNHGTWTTAAVGMTGYVLGEQEWVEQALYDLEKSGKGGFMKQLDELFSPQGYYNEGPYYQRYALMPFVTFAKAIQTNEPERKIFEYRDGILLKAIDTTIQLSYNKLFFPINDAIKSKGIDTIELVNGVTIAYGLTQDAGLLDIAKQQDQIVLTGDGLKVANAIDKGLDTPYQFKSVAFGDGNNGKQGALVVMRQNVGGEQALLFKPAAQGLGHGHFDKLTWQFYDRQQEIVSDYGAARFLNVEAKFGGRYLPENGSYAKHTVAHNTVVVDQTSHFNSNVEVGNANHPEVIFFDTNDKVKISSAKIDTAYKGVELKRTLALINLPKLNQSLVVDVFDVSSDKAHQLDLPLHYKGHLIETNFELGTKTESISALGKNNGYQHMWLKAQSSPKSGLAKITWLNEDNGRFYTQTSLVDGKSEMLFTQLGANDPNFNLRNENAFIARVNNTKKHSFVSVFEPHGEYNPSKEFTIDATSKLKTLQHKKISGLDIVAFSFGNQVNYILAFNSQKADSTTRNKFSYNGKSFEFTGHSKFFEINK